LRSIFLFAIQDQKVKKNIKKKGENMLRLAFIILFVTGCSYKPVIDSAGRSGTFPNSKAEEITNDEQHCRYVAKSNTTFLSNITYWLFDEDMQTKYQSIYRKCLVNRGHSVLN
jgi:hypothetical protein